MDASEWVLLLERPSGDAFDDATVEFLLLEQVLKEQAIACTFDPCRPGEGIHAGYGSVGLCRLLVHPADLLAAQQVVADLASAEPDLSDQESVPEGIAEPPPAEGSISTPAHNQEGAGPRLATAPPMAAGTQPGCLLVLLWTIASLGLYVLGA